MILCSTGSEAGKGGTIPLDSSVRNLNRREQMFSSGKTGKHREGFDGITNATEAGTRVTHMYFILLVSKVPRN